MPIPGSNVAGDAADVNAETVNEFSLRSLYFLISVFKFYIYSRILYIPTCRYCEV